MAEIVSTVWIAHVTDAYMCIAVKDNVRGGLTMDDYIERKRAIVNACNSLELYPSEYAKLEDALNKISAADVVPVVRCRDCKYRFRNNGHDKNGCPITDADIWMDDNSFCSYGERKEGGK